MAVPFPEAEFEVLIYMLLGAFMALTIASSIYIWKLRKFLQEDFYSQESEQEFRVDNIGLSRRAEETLEVVMEKPILQSELPDELGVSKATVSNAIGELFERSLVIKKKKANTYRIEPDMDEIEKQQR